MDGGCSGKGAGANHRLFLDWRLAQLSSRLGWRRSCGYILRHLGLRRPRKAWSEWCGPRQMRGEGELEELEEGDAFYG